MTNDDKPADTVTEALTAEQLEEITEYALGWYPVGSTERIDWDDLLLRIEEACEIDLPDSHAHAVILTIKTAVNRARREG